MICRTILENPPRSVHLNCPLPRNTYFPRVGGCLSRVVHLSLHPRWDTHFRLSAPKLILLPGEGRPQIESCGANVCRYRMTQRAGEANCVHSLFRSHLLSGCADSSLLQNALFSSR